MVKPMPEETVKHHSYRQLDGLRGIAALIVFFGHFSKIGIDITKVNVLARGTIGILVNGAASVIFFFVLSGFVLSLPYVNSKTPLKLTSFYLKRVFRIYPALIIAIILCVILKEFFVRDADSLYFSFLHKGFWNWQLNSASIKEIIKSILLIGPGFDSGFINPPIWSLVVEMKMSILMPFFILIVARNSVVLNISLFFILGYLTYKYGMWQIDVFYIGILMAKYKDQLILKISNWPSITLITVVITSIGLYNNNFIFLHLYNRLQNPFNIEIAGFFIAIGSGILMMIILSRKSIADFFEKRTFNFLGDVSYSFYLIHFPILFTTTSILYGKYPYSPIYIFLVSLTLSVAISYLIFIFIEQPAKKAAVHLIKKYKIFNMITV